MNKIHILLLLSAFSLDLNCQDMNNDTAGSVNTTRLSAIYMGLGAGPVNGGFDVGISGTFIINEHFDFCSLIILNILEK